MTIAGCASLLATSKLPEQLAVYKKRRDFFTERYDEVKLQYNQDSSSVKAAYTALLSDDIFRGLKKKAQCREKANISDFYQCVGDLYSEASFWGFSVGGIFVTLGAAYGVSQKSSTASMVLVLPMVGLGVTYVVYGGIFKSKADEYKAMAGH